MIKVEFSNNYAPDILKVHSFLSDNVAIEKLFTYAYLDESIKSSLKDEDPTNEKEHLVSLLLTDDDEIKTLNKEYRDIDNPTDVLSFPQDDAFVLGDIVISVDTLLRNAEELGVTVKDEYFRLLLHSFLHLLGYDHATNDFENEPMLIIQEKIFANFKNM